MPDDIIVSPVPPSPCPSNVTSRNQAWSQVRLLHIIFPSMILTTHLWAICSDEENVKDDTNDTDDNFTVSMWQLWVDLIKEMNDAEEIHCHRYGNYYY